jgi:membrane-associated phospholipid phosphatase
MPLRAELAPSRRTLTVAAALVAANLTLFVLIAEDVLDGGGLISHDEAVLTWFVDHRTDWLIRAAKLISTIGSFASLSVIGLLLGIWLWRRSRHSALAAAPLVSLAIAGLAATTAKTLFDRERPPVTVHATTVTLAAFPSGHATDAAAFFLAASLTLAITITRNRSAQAVLIAVGVLLAALVGVSRLVLGVHWLSDVVAGWALGSAIAIGVVVTFWYFTTRHQAGTRNANAHP